ncbi:hypothetical protein ALP75_203549 [Pseudomonas syringae pv. actinidiae]|nr:hypothetical protein ALP75_203549 [Pseudomonas syringae pv. actinidiae]
MIAQHHKQGVFEVRLFFGLLEELAQRPVGVTHGGQMLIQRTVPGHTFNRQRVRQCVRCVVGQGLQQRIERLAVLPGFEFLCATVEHVLVGNTPGRVREHRINEVFATDKVGHALVAEETRLVVPGKVAVIDVDVIVVTTGAQQLWQARQLVAALRRLHQVFETRQVREACHGGKHALVGVGAVGEEVVEQQTFFGQLVEIRRDVGIVAQRTDRVAGEAFHQDHNHIANRQRVFNWRREVTAHRSNVRLDQLVVRRQQHVAYSLLRIRLRQGGFPDVVAIFGHTALGRSDQGQRAIKAQLVGEIGIGGVRITPAQRRALTQGAADADDHDQQDQNENTQAHVPRRNAADIVGARRRNVAWPCQTVDALEHQAQQPGHDGPGEQVTHHRKAVPEHAQNGLRVFLDVLEHQTVQALVKLTVEVHFHKAEEQRDAADQREPEPEEPACCHGPGAEQRQHQRNEQVHGQAQVETRAVEQRFEEGRGWRVTNHLAVVDQQTDTQQGVHHHQRETAEQDVSQMRFDSRVLQAGLPMKLGVRFGHGCQDPVDSENRFESAAPPCSRTGRRAAGRRYYLIAGRLGAR